ncbi:uncharacterized protein LOC110466448 [Mizuhopecten yessoensis]|uniref:uncharacterized protein LOC110447817 n=1 Tax=Mizuhopecten yessoensis TaxID=6573 RepID=UPI000B45E6C9|nr:uncharacterized protein LOC110447817 [Mizuhopecten yessoensis]XP_021378621.1 uncharacterized protein LOC110466448 [Mizuhopecten yessoensis]
MIQTTLSGEPVEARCHCGKICKNSRGLKIHQARTKCGHREILTQRTDISNESGETQEELSQESNHSTESLQASVSPDGSIGNLNEASAHGVQAVRDRRLDKVQWPKTNDEAAWRNLDQDLEAILETTLQGNVERKVEALTSIVYSVCKERFGVETSRTQPRAKTTKENRRERKIKQLRKELRELGKRFKTAPESEKVGIQQIRDDLRETLRRLRNAERLRKGRKERAKRRADFVKDPFQFSKTLLGAERSGHLESSKEEVEAHLKGVHSDNRRAEPLGYCPRILEVEAPSAPLDTKLPTWKEIQDVVKKARSGSAPGPSGITYRVYKKCPRLLRRLWQLICKVWKKGTIPACWKKAEGIFAPKEKDSKTVEQFRTISLLSVEGKIFFSILAKRMTAYMVENSYVDTSSQKGGIPGFSGCVEHTSVISQLIREAKQKKGNLTVVWLDLANAYGSVPHKLIEAALDHYHIPEHIRKMIMSYFGGIQLRFTVGESTTAWQDLEKGIVTGCTISPILFIMGMNIIIKAAERETRGPRMESGIYQPANRGFMDDLTITTTTHVQARWVLSALEEVVTWARMQFKPRKSRCMIMRNGRLSRQFVLKVQEEEIPSIIGSPIKCLGKWFDDTLSDSQNHKNTQSQVRQWMKKIHKSGLPGKYKAWIYQHGMLPRLTWLLLLYEIPTSTVEGLEKMVNGYLRKWLGVPPSFTSVGLYSCSAELQLPFKSVVEEFKVAKCRLVMTLRDSKDVKISEAGIQTRTGRKWSASTAVGEAESMLELKDIIGNTCVGRQGVGFSHFQQWEKANTQERRQMVQKEIRRIEEERRRGKSVELSKQGAWTRWNLPERKMTWAEIWRMEPFRISFLLRSVYDTLPSPVNLHQWGLTEDPCCKLCGGRGTMAHILSGCKEALRQGRYRWRHDNVLRVLADILEVERRKKRTGVRTNQAGIKFVKPGEKATVKPRSTSSIFERASTWEMKVDLDRKLVFPGIVETTLRPDMVIWTEQSRHLIAIELTVPWEEGCEEAHERKKAKYDELMEKCRSRGWTVWLFPVEVGCRGFPAQSVWRTLRSIGLTGRARATAIRRLGEAAERASCWLWHKRDEPMWKPT